jgi:hypothetical protein
MRVITPRGVYTLTELARQLECSIAALYRYLEYRGCAWHLKPLDEECYNDWRGKVHQAVPERDRPFRQRIPVYDERGELFADSITDAAKQLRCSVANLLYNNYLRPHRYGMQLKRRPPYQSVLCTLPVVGPGGRRWPSVQHAAQELGVQANTIYRASRRDGDRAFILLRTPRARRQEAS